MNFTAVALLAASILFGAGRNLLSKKIACTAAQTKPFYQLQAVLFLSGAIALSTTLQTLSISGLTVVWAIVYAALLLSAQLNYTTALQRGSVGVCSTVYSLGFVLPTLSGALLWGEPLSIFKGIGLGCALGAVVAAGNKPEKHVNHAPCFAPLLLAMLSSGGLGIMQKVQQSSAVKDERAVFVILAFALAGILSLFKATRSAEPEKPLPANLFFSASLVGICFGLCNYLNTTLAGMLESAMLFPVLNIGTILLSLVVGLVAYKEPFTKRTMGILLLGVLAIGFICQ